MIKTQGWLSQALKVLLYDVRPTVLTGQAKAKIPIFSRANGYNCNLFSLKLSFIVRLVRYLAEPKKLRYVVVILDILINDSISSLQRSTSKEHFFYL